jgi:hypothetical protein
MEDPELGYAASAPTVVSPSCFSLIVAHAVGDGLIEGHRAPFRPRGRERVGLPSDTFNAVCRARVGGHTGVAARRRIEAAVGYRASPSCASHK